MSFENGLPFAQRTEEDVIMNHVTWPALLVERSH